MDREVIYIGRDNPNEFILTANDVAQNLSGVTHMELVISGVTYSSVTSGYFSWSGSTTGYVKLTFGNAPSLTPGNYDAELIVYDVSRTYGVLWGKIPLKIEG